MGLSDWISLLTMVVLAITAIAIFRYTKETSKMKNEMVQQTELSIRPLITVNFDKKECECFIENVGYGVAMNIKIDDLYIAEELKEFKLRYVFDTIYAIMPKDIKKLNIDNYEAYFPDETKVSKGDPFLAKLGDHLIRESHELDITYENLIGSKYSSKVQCGKDGNIFLETKKLGK